MDRDKEDRVGRGGIAGSPQESYQQAVRQSGREMLLERARRLHRQAAALERLAGALPSELPEVADEALWELASRL